MRKFLLSFIVSVVVTNGYAQLQKVPANATMVARYSGKSLSQKLSVKKIDSYAFVQDHLLKALKLDSLGSLDNTGISLDKDIFQYVSWQDSSMNFVTLFNLKDARLFTKLLQANISANVKSERKSGYEILPLSQNTFVGWNATEAVLVVSEYDNPRRYEYYGAADTTVVETIVPDTVVVEEERVEEPKAESVPDKPAKGKKNSKAKGKNSAAAKTPPPPPPPPVDVVDEEITYDDEDEYKVSYEDSVQNAKVNKWYLEQDSIKAERQKQVAYNLADNFFTATATSIASDASYNKVIDNNADVSIWFNYENLMSRYWATFFKSFGPLTAGMARPANQPETNAGFRNGINIYFEQDKMRIEQTTWSPDEKMAKLGKELFKSKQKQSLANFINPDNIAYFSMSINTEAMANYYYRLIRQYLGSNSYTSEYTDIIDAYVDFLEIIIDEKAIAELMPGNCVFVLHDMKTKEVKYTTYEYDDDFKATEVQKTKQELSPNFTFVADTKKEPFVQKLINLPKKYAEKGDYKYVDRGGYHEYIFEEGKSPFSSIYFMVSNGLFLVTTSKASIDMAMNKTGYDLPAETRKSVLKNNYSLRINSRKLIQQISAELTTGTSKQVSTYLEENVGDITMESRLKDGTIQSTTNMSVTGKHSNSLEFFFNMIEEINNIIQKSRESGEEILN